MKNNNNHITKILIAVCGITVPMVAFFFLNFQIQEKNIAALDYEIDKSVISITEEVNKIDLVLNSMEIFHQMNDSISKEVFTEYTEPFISHLPGILALEWAPTIHAEEKERFVKFQEATNYRTFSITEKSEDGKLIASKNKSLYYPVLYINPLKPNKTALGYNLYSDINRKATIDKAISSKLTTITKPIKLIQINNDTYGFLAIKSVVINSKTKGIVLSVYNMDSFIKNIVKNNSKLFELNIYDTEDNYAMMFSSDNSTTPYLKNSNLIEKHITVYNRDWTLVFTPYNHYTLFPHSFSSYVILLLSLLVISLIIVLIMRNENYQKTLEHKILKRTTDLNKVISQKEILLKEIHHRVKNSLQLTSSIIRLQKNNLKDKDAINVLSSSEARISAISLVHKFLYQNENLDFVRLDKYIKELITYNQNLSKTKIIINSPEIEIHIDIATPLSLIINELISNCLEHAFTSNSSSNLINVNVEEIDTDLIKITVTDNGKGYPENFDHKVDGALGLEIIAALSEQLRADTTFKNLLKGTQTTVIFKKKL